MKTDRILVTGACSRFGAELTVALREKYRRYNVIAADKKITADILLDVPDQEELNNVARECGVTQIYHLAKWFCTSKLCRSFGFPALVKSINEIIKLFK